MAAPFETVWMHYSGNFDSTGYLWVAPGVDSDKHAIAGGGFATEPPSTSTDEDTTWTGSHGQAAEFVGTTTNYYEPSDLTVFTIGFKGTPGGRARVHAWVHVVDSI